MPENSTRPEWLAALNAAEQAGLIPNFPPATTPDGGNTIVYPADVNAGAEPICSAYFQCRHADDVWDAPPGMIGLSVDDGPSGDPTASARLYDFLQQNNQKITHFMIGANILAAPDLFTRAFQTLDSQFLFTKKHSQTNVPQTTSACTPGYTVTPAY
jgi:chitin deacetylase